MKKFFLNLFLALPLLLATGCNSMLFDDEVGEDCAPHYKVRFCYDMNMKFADAFHVEVNAVTLYVIDETTEKIVWTVTESGQKLKQDGYEIDVPVAPGNYKLLAWCGDGVKSHFSIPESDTHRDLKCTLLADIDERGGKKVQKALDRLYHGKLDNQDFPAEYGTYVYTVPLVKNTNEVNVVLQHLSGKPVDKDKFHFSITDDNSLMDWDNKLIPNGQITYHAHEVLSGTAGVDMPDDPDLDTPQSKGRSTRTLTQVSACVASLSTGRFVKGQDMRLYIHNDKGEQVVNLPVIDYSLLVKGYSHRQMDDQEYLDREDKYDMVFFLDDHDNWINTAIYINSWRIVINQTDL